MGERSTVRTHTTRKIPTSETSFSMVYGTESVIPVKIGLPSFQISNFDKENNESKLRFNLDLLDEKKEWAEVHQAAYKHQVAIYYNQRVKHISFLLGDLVLRKVTLSTKELNARKLGPTISKGFVIPDKILLISRLPIHYKMIRHLDCHFECCLYRDCPFIIK